MTALSVQGLSKSFGGVHAICDVSFDVAPQTVYAMIGPNGAGKTTLINLITGIYTPDAGSITVFGTRANDWSPERVALAGVSRTFQNLQVCMNMSAVENVMIGAHKLLRGSLFLGMLQPPFLRKADTACRERALSLMEFVGIEAFANAQASELPYGALKRLEIARALASGPRLVLLDEPAAGLNQTEKLEIARLIRRVAEEGVTVILVEHDMKLVMGISDQVLVLDYGRRLVQGTVDEVRNNPEVIAAYLGVAA